MKIQEKIQVVKNTLAILFLGFLVPASIYEFDFYNYNLWIWGFVGSVIVVIFTIMFLITIIWLDEL